MQSCPRTVGHLVALHILACHLDSPAWHCMGPAILSYSYSSTILFPALFLQQSRSTSSLLYLFLLKTLARKLHPPLIGSSSSCPIKCNLEAPSRAIRAASLPTSCNEAQHILESIAPLVSPNGTSLLSKKQCKWKWTYSLASHREKPLLLSACNSGFQTHRSEPPPFGFCMVRLQLALFLWQPGCLCVCVCVQLNMFTFYWRWEGNGTNMNISIIGIHSVCLQKLIASWTCAFLCKVKCVWVLTSVLHCLPSPREHLFSGPGLCPQPAVWCWEAAAAREPNKEFKTLKSFCD